MKRLFFVLWWALLSSGSYAAAPAYTTSWQVGISGPTYISAQAACDAHVAANASRTFDSLVMGAPGSGTATCKFKVSGTVYSQSLRLISVALCEDGAKPDTTKPLDQQCADPVPPGPACTPGRVWEANIPVNLGDPLPTNVSGCTQSNHEVVGCWFDAGTNQTYCRYKMTEGGAAPDGSSESTPSAVPPTSQPSDVPPFNPSQGQGCPKGTVNMGTDSAGLSICGGKGTAPAPTAPPPITTKPPVVTNNPDGSTIKTEVTEQTNSDGSTTTRTRTTTTAADGTTTVTESESTGQNSTGGTGKPDATKEEVKDDFCKQHPELNICKNSQVTGSCDSMSCTGDAIQCAIAREVAKQRCKAEKDEADVKAGSAYQTGIAAQNGTVTGLPTPGNAQTINVQSSLDQNGWLGAGGCFSDKTFTIQGETITIPFSEACEYLIVFRYAIMILAALVAFRMLSGTFLRE